MAQRPIDTPYLTHTEAATYCRVSVRTLRTLESLRKGPPVAMVGGKRVYHRTDLDTWIRSQKKDRA